MSEQDIERLAQEIGRLIRAAEPQKREDLKELAFTLIREEVIQGDVGEQAAEGSVPKSFNPLGMGILISILGVGLSFIFGPVGVMLFVGGLLMAAWGAVISWVKR